MRQGCFRSAGCGSSGFGRRANLLKSYFSGFQPAEMHFFRRKNRFLLREASRTSDSAFPASSSFYHLLTPKGGTKSVRQAKTSGNGRRLAPKTLRGQARARVFDGASAARSSSRFFAMRSCCALRATMIICWCLFLAVLWPARMHCFRYFRSAIPQTRGLLIQLKDSLFGRSRRAATHSYPTIDPHPGILSGFLRRRTERIFNS